MFSTAKKIEVNNFTDNPDKAWSLISKNFTVTKVPYAFPANEKDPDYVRIVCTSDTHSCLKKSPLPIPNGDIFIHAGDFTMNGRKSQITEFNDWLGQLPHPHKVVIAGNHELTLDSKQSDKYKEMESLLTNCTYLKDSGIELMTLKIWGTPWQPVFGGWAFNLRRGKEILKMWDLIPSDTDILISHGPALGIGDLCKYHTHAGCVELLSTIRKRLNLKLHVFGHIHEDFGVFRTNELETIFVNASMCNISYQPQNAPLVFDLKKNSGNSQHEPIDANFCKTF